MNKDISPEPRVQPIVPIRVVKPTRVYDLPTDFVSMFFCLSDELIAWPSDVQVWGGKAPQHQYALDQLRSEARSHPAGFNSPIVLRLIEEVLKAVKG